VKLKNKTKVAISIPVRNGESSILTCLKSIQKQSYKNFQVLISDNNSSDKTGIICKKFVKKDKRFKYLKQTKAIPVYENFRLLFNKTKEEYFMWLASHHKISKDYIYFNLKFLKKNQDYIASTSFDYFIDEKRVDGQSFGFDKDVYKNLKIFFKNCWRTHGIFYALFRRSKIKKLIKELRPYPASDWLFMILLIFSGKINRSKKGFLILGRQGASSGENPYMNLDKKYLKSYNMNFFNKNFFKIVKKNRTLNFWQKKYIYILIIKLNLKCILSKIKKNFFIKF